MEWLSSQKPVEITLSWFAGKPLPGSECAVSNCWATALWRGSSIDRSPSYKFVLQCSTASLRLAFPKPTSLGKPVRGKGTSDLRLSCATEPITVWIGTISIPESHSRMASSSPSTAAFAPLMHVNMHCRAVDELLNQELFDSHDDAGRKLALWRYDYNNIRPHSSLANQTPAEARRALRQIERTAHDVLAQNETTDYEIQTCRLSL